MTNPIVDVEGSEWQPADEYEPYFNDAVLPAGLAPYSCDHDADPPICRCVHDWRIHWGNPARKSQARSTYVTS